LNEQKQFLGNYLYQFVYRKMHLNESDISKVELLTGRITGMILDG
jgi:hypothetical protein